MNTIDIIQPEIKTIAGYNKKSNKKRVTAVSIAGSAVGIAGGLACCIFAGEEG